MWHSVGTWVQYSNLKSKGYVTKCRMIAISHQQVCESVQIPNTAKHQVILHMVSKYVLWN